MFKSRRWIPALIVSFLLVSGLNLQPASAYTAVDITTQHNDNQRTGANLQETVLNTSNVNPEQFGKLYELPVDGQVYAQPLYLSDMYINGKVRNVLYVATMHNTVYCIDADDPNGEILWEKNLGPSVALPDDNIGPSPAEGGYRDINTEIGILSTPVIVKEKEAIYMVAMTKKDGEYAYKLHALDLLDGSEKSHSPQTISASFPNSNHEPVTFETIRQAIRPALTYANGRIYLGSASFGAKHVYYGWILGYDAETLAQKVVFNSSPDAQMSGIWQSGQGLVVDPDGNLIFQTGAGAATNIVGGPDYGDSVVKMSKDSAAILDWFTPYNYDDLYWSNEDLSASGPMLIPGSNTLIAGGKEGKIYVLNINDLGHMADHDSQVQVIPTGGHLFGSPVYWSGPSGPRVYVWPGMKTLRAYQLEGDHLSSDPVSESAEVSSAYMPGAILSVSADGDRAGSGIVWANMPYNGGNPNQMTVEGVLRAYDANDLTHELWDSKMNDDRDHLGNFAKFVAPTVANGKVYMATFSGRLDVYGLLSSPDPANLTSLTLNNGGIVAQFDVASRTYSASVAHEVDAVTIQPTAAEGVTISVNGQPVESGASSEAIPLQVGSNTIPVTVTAGDTTKTYTVSVTRAEAYTKYEAEDATLSNGAGVNQNHANYSGNGFVDGFTSDHEGASAAFHVSSADGGALSVGIRYANGTGGAQTLSLYLNGSKVRQTELPPTGDWDTWQDKYETLNLDAGISTIALQYDEGDSANVNIDYLTIPGAPAPLHDNALLAGLTLSAGIHFSEPVTGTVYHYTASAPNNVSETTVNVEVADPGHATAAVQVNGVPADGPIPLAVGSTTITIIVTAENGSTQQYDVVVTRESDSGGNGGNGGDTGGGGGGGSVSIPLPVATPSDIPPTLTTDAAGKKIWLVRPNKDKLLSQLDQATSEIVINGAASESVDQLTVELPGDVLAKAGTAGKTIVIVGNGVQIALPPGLIGGNVGNATFKLNILQTTGEETLPLGPFIPPAYTFTVTDEAGGKVAASGKSTIISFDVDLSKLSNPADAQLYFYNEATESWEYVTGSLQNDLMTASVTRLGKYAVFAAHKTFGDIQGHWAQQEIENLAVRQIVTGITDVTFGPEAQVTRAEFVTLLARALNLHHTTGGNPFADVPANSWYADSVNAAYEAQIVNGVDNGKFGPDGLITREQMAALLVKAYQYASGKDLPIPDVNDGLLFTDAADISGWAKENVKLSASLGLMEGVNGAFSPIAPATRAQAAVVIYRLLNLL